MVVSRTGGDAPAGRGPERPPIKLTILGNSQAVMCSPPAGPRSDRTYAQWLRYLPTRQGTTIEVVNAYYEVADVRHSARIWSSMADEAPPDVLLIHLGTSEVFSLATPHWLWHLFLGSERHAGPHHRAFERARPRLWLVLRAYQRKVDRWMGPRGGRVGPSRFERGIKSIITEARVRGNPLVLLGDVAPLERMARNTPSAPARLALAQEALLRVVEDLDDPDVQLVPIRSLVDAAGGVSAVMPDGYHFTPDLHRQVAEAVWDAVSSWEERTEGHTSPGDRRPPLVREPPLRVTVIAARDLAPAEGQGEDRSYPSLLHASGLDADRPPDVFTVSRPGADVRLAIDAFQPAVQQVTPDVVVIDAGSGGGRLSPDRLRRELQIAIRLARRVSSPLVLVLDDPREDREGAPRRAARRSSRDATWAIESAVRAFATDEVRRLQVPVPAERAGDDSDRGRLPEVVHGQVADLISAEIRGWHARASSGATL